jgi:hypothetical protein
MMAGVILPVVNRKKDISYHVKYEKISDRKV